MLKLTYLLLPNHRKFYQFSQHMPRVSVILNMVSTTETQHTLTKLITSAVVDSSMYVNCNTIYHHNGMKSTKIIPTVCYKITIASCLRSLCNSYGLLSPSLTVNFTIVRCSVYNMLMSSVSAALITKKRRENKELTHIKQTQLHFRQIHVFNCHTLTLWFKQLTI